ncbi:hypothetical protein BH10PSE11_BH10PSE11_08170 [soil metagenome]
MTLSNTSLSADENNRAIALLKSAIQQWRDRKVEKARNRKLLRDAESARKRRADARSLESASRAVLRDRLFEEHHRRNHALDTAVKRGLRDKRLEQLLGRARELANFWLAMEIAAIHTKGAVTPSDAKIAGAYIKLTGDKSFNRHKARSKRLIVLQLERPGQPWDKLSCGSPSKERKKLA